MEEVVGILVKDSLGKRHGFLTWGRAFGELEGARILKAVMNVVGTFGIKKVTHSKICKSVGELAEFEYFYESFFSMAQTRVPFGPGYKKWQAAVRKALAKGKQIYYLGSQPR